MPWIKFPDSSSASVIPGGQYSDLDLLFRKKLCSDKVSIVIIVNESGGRQMFDPNNRQLFAIMPNRFSEILLARLCL